MYIVAEIIEMNYDYSSGDTFQGKVTTIDKPICVALDELEAKEQARIASVKDPGKVFTIFSPFMEICAKVEEMTEERYL